MSVNTIDEYIAMYDGEVKLVLEKTREAILGAAPLLSEKMSWQMPTFWQKENIIHFAANKNHLGIYPGPQAIIAFAERLKGYKTSKGAIQFPFSKPVPYDLIADIVKWRLGQIT